MTRVFVRHDVMAYGNKPRWSLAYVDRFGVWRDSDGCYMVAPARERLSWPIPAPV
jgi:hypothetical protein